MEKPCSIIKPEINISMYFIREKQNQKYENENETAKLRVGNHLKVFNVNART